MYDLGKGIEVVEKPSPARRALLEYVKKFLAEPSEADLEVLGRLLNANYPDQEVE